MPRKKTAHVSGGASQLQYGTANFQAAVGQARESSDNPMLKAFSRVARRRSNSVALGAKRAFNEPRLPDRIFE
jgi:hypothetical protein